MSEPELKQTLAAYASAVAPPDQLAAIRQEAVRRKARRRWTRGTIAALLLSFAFLTFAPVGGSALAVVRKEIQPTLFLKTSWGEAQKVIRSPLQLPPTYPDWTGEDMPFTDGAQALVGRWLSYEMVAVAVTSEEDATGIISFDLRRTTYKPEPGEEYWIETPGAIYQDVKVGDANGRVRLEPDGGAWQIRWATNEHLYRLTVGRPMTAEDLAAYAAQIK